MSGPTKRAGLVTAVAVLLVLAGIGVALSPDLQRRIGFELPARASTGDRGSAKPADAAPRSVSVVTATATATDFPIRRSGVGFVSSPTVVNVNARVSSQVVEVAVKDGQTVQAGDLLFRLDDRSLRAQLAKDQATLAKDQAMLAGAQADLGRAKDLLGRGAGTQQAYDQQQANTKGLQATVQADEATVDADTVQLGYATIAAPMGGRLGEINTAVGDLVGPSSGGTQSTASAAAALVSITQMDPLQVTINLPEADLSLLRKEMADPAPDAVALTLPGKDEVIARGTLDFIDSSVDTTSGTIAVRASVSNADGRLWPGLYVEVGIQFGTLPQAVSIPAVAVQQGQKGAFVYRVEADGKARMQPVTIALTDDGAAAIQTGLSAGDKVVVEGQGRLKDGASVREEGAAGDAGGARAGKKGGQAASGAAAPGSGAASGGSGGG